MEAAWGCNPENWIKKLNNGLCLGFLMHFYPDQNISWTQIHENKNAISKKFWTHCGKHISWQYVFCFFYAYCLSAAASEALKTSVAAPTALVSTTPSTRARGTWGLGGTFFCTSVKPVPTKGADYAHYTTTCPNPTRFSDLPTALGLLHLAWRSRRPFMMSRHLLITR